MCLGAGGEEVSGVDQIIMISIAVFVFSELKSANKEDVANTYGVMNIAFTYTILFHE